jgi:NADH:ubiquinone oxidoreductase subunit K
MNICEGTLILSGFLFCVGLLGLVMQRGIVKAIISIETMIFAGIVNFTVPTGDFPIRSGHFAILIVVMLGGLMLSIIFTIYNSQMVDDKNVDLMDRGNDV